MKKRLMIIGAGGHGKVCAEIAELNGYESVSFLDDSDSKENIVFGKTEEFTRFIEDYDFFVALGDNRLRKSFLTRIADANGSVATLIHPNSTVSAKATVGAGSVVMAGAVINPSTVVGKGAIINTASSLDHDNVLKDYVHIGVGAHLAGTVHIGEGTFIGAGATIINNVTVCEDSIVGAGATVIKDIREKGTYIGTPARKIK